MSDKNRALVVGTQVIFESGRVRREVITNDEGFYEVELPPGVYSVTTYKLGFCPLRRATFTVEPDRVMLLNIRLNVCALVHGARLKDGKWVEEAWQTDGSKTESFLLKRKQGSLGELFIRYATRREHKGHIEYSGTEDEMPGRVVVTYNLLTIWADKVSYDKKKHVLLAAGNVYIEEDRRSYGSYRSAEFNFKSDDPLKNFVGKEYDFHD